MIADAGRWARAENKNKQEHLARGYDLSLHRDLAARRPSWITGSERAYVDASRRAAVTAARLKQTAIAGLVLLTFIALGFGYYASNQRNIAFELFSQSQALVKEIGKAQQETSEALELAKQKAADEDRAKREAERERDRADAQLKKEQMTQSLFLANLARQQRADGAAAAPAP